MHAPDSALDTNLWPVVVVTLPAVIEEPAVEAFLPLFESTVFVRRATYALIIDGTALSEMPSPRVRQLLGAWRRANAERLTTYSTGTRS